MNAESKIVLPYQCNPALPGKGDDLFRQGLGQLEALVERNNQLHGVLDLIGKAGDRATVKRARKLSDKLNDAEPAVTMIGQVKAGKTSLVNAMVGMPGLLPSDVNPWTSVVTSLHLDPKGSTAQNRADFQFFDRSEWDRLVVGGGRIGELARRAGAASELERVSQQIATMQEKSRQRLGKKFELLLGQEHDYSYFDSDLIERYVCLGDDFEDDTETSQARGRFADITKSAQIFMHSPATPTKLCIRDTPGVNDTFLVREQITIRAIRESRICVMVLAAHQAMSSVDLALIRLISNVKSREVIIFINRIDELSDPARQVPEIRASIAETLQAHQGPTDATVIFGSAHWANQVLDGQLTGIDDKSAASLLNYARSALDEIPPGLSTRETIWHLSGVASLHRALADRICEGPGQETFAAVARKASNLLNGLKVTNRATEPHAVGTVVPTVDRNTAAEGFEMIESESLLSLEDGLSELRHAFVERIERVHSSFLDRATASLIEHIETHGEQAVWKYDPTGLRILLRSSYRTFAKRSKDLIQNILLATANDSAAFLESSFSIPEDAFEMEPPEATAAPSPVILGQTIALDLESNWWSTWWKQQEGAKAHTKEFSDMIAAETAPIFHGLKNDYATVIRNDAIAVLSDFLAEQKQVLEDLLRQSDAADGDEFQPRMGNDNQARVAMAEKASASLKELLEKADG